MTRFVDAVKHQGALKPQGIRQRMSGLHIWAGLLAGWLLYAMFLTGTVSYFRDEISAWMRPELPAVDPHGRTAGTAQIVADAMRRIAPGSDQWAITLPDGRNGAAQVRWSGGRPRAGQAFVSPTTGDTLTVRDTYGGDFFFRFHYNFQLPMPLGRWLAGVCAMFMLVAIVSGVITHKKIFTDFFTFRPRKGQRSWLDAHNALAVLGLPFHLMITYTGLVTLMFVYMPWGSQAAFKTPDARRALTIELAPQMPRHPASGQAAKLAPISPLVQQAELMWGQDKVGGVWITHPGDAQARVLVIRGEAGRPSASPRYMVFDGVSGRLLEDRSGVKPAAETRGVLMALHIGRFADGFTRWLYFLVSLAGTAMVATGLVLWTVKRRAQCPDGTRPPLGLRVVERINVPVIAGLPIAMAAMLWANRLLPVLIPQRALWELAAFFAAWALALAHGLVRPAARAWAEQLWSGAAVLALLPVLHALTAAPDGAASPRVDGFGLTVLALATLLAFTAWKAAQRR